MFSGFGVPSAKTPAFRTLQENPGRCLAVLAGTAKIEMFRISKENSVFAGELKIYQRTTQAAVESPPPKAVSTT